MRSRIAFGVGAVLAMVSVSANGQCVQGWQTMDGSYLFAERVQATVSWDPDGAGPAPEVLVVGGSFNHLGSVSCSNVAQWNGTVWQPLGAGTNDTVHALAVYNGEVVAGGVFTSAGGGPASYLARWSGASWQPLGTSPNSHVYALAVYNGDLIAGGNFTSIGGISCNRTGRWNGASWQALGGGTNHWVTAMTIEGSELVAGGNFTQAGGVSCGRLARWNGTTWLGTAATINTWPQALAIYGGQLVAAGNYLQTPNTPIQHLARWDGAAWQPFGGGPWGNVDSLLLEGGELIIGGQFDFADGVPTGPVARWNGAAWQSVGPAIPGNNASVRSLRRYQGELFAGGNSFGFAASPAHNITARLTYPVATVSLAQPGGAGSGTMVSNAGLIPGREYYNVASYEPCGVQGSGPYAGLCFTDLAFLSFQLGFPIGFHPFHFAATSQNLVVGPYSVPTGTYDLICADVTGGVVGCISQVARFSIQ